MPGTEVPQYVQDHDRPAVPSRRSSSSTDWSSAPQPSHRCVGELTATRSYGGREYEPPRRLGLDGRRSVDSSGRTRRGEPAVRTVGPVSRSRDRPRTGLRRPPAGTGSAGCVTGSRRRTAGRYRDTRGWRFVTSKGACDRGGLIALYPTILAGRLCIRATRSESETAGRGRNRREQ
jgi:hypothetical protein